MAGRIWIGPYKPLGVSTQAVPGGGYLNVDASAGNFGPSPLAQLGLQVAGGAAGIAGTVAEQLAGDNEAFVKTADVKMGETEQALLFDSQNGHLNLQGQDATTQAPAVLDAYTKAQDQQMATLTDADQRRMFADLADRRLATFTTQVERHAAAERQRWYDAASDGRIAQMQADARLHWTDDALLRRSLGTARAEVRDQAERKGWDSALTEAALRQQTSRTLVSAIGAAVDRDPERAQSLRTRYATALADHDRAALDALLAEARARGRAQAASTEVLKAAPPDGSQPTLHWRLRQTEVIADPAERAATIRRLLGASAAAESRARTLGEQVLARVLKDGLTDPSQVPIREWVSLDAGRRQAIETRLDHNARSTEPAPNPALVDALATEMTQAPYDFARRDLVPAIAHLPLPQWQRFHDWQAGLRRNDPTTEDELYAIKRGLQLATKVLPADIDDDETTNIRAGLIEDIDTERRITGKSPDDDDIVGMLGRYVSPGPHSTHMLRWDPRARTESTPDSFISPRQRPDDRPGIHRIQDKTESDENRRESAKDRRFRDVVNDILAMLLQSMGTRPTQTPNSGPQRGQMAPPQQPIPPHIPMPRTAPPPGKPPSSPSEKMPSAPTSRPAPPLASTPNAPPPKEATPPLQAGPTGGRGMGGFSGRALPELKFPDVVRGSDAQWGLKFGRHGQDLGLKTHQEYRDLANQIRNDPNSKITRYPPDAPMYRGETHFESGGRLLRLDPNGEFRSLY